MAEFGAPLEESTTGGWFGFKSRQFKIDEYGNLEMDEMKTAEAGPEELDPFAEEFEMGGDSFVQDTAPLDVEAVDWAGLDAEALEEQAFELEVEEMYGVETVAVEAEVGEAVAESLEISGAFVEGAISGSVAGYALGAALSIGMTLWGESLLKKYRASVIPEIADDNPFMGSIVYVVVGKIWLPGYIDAIVQRKKKTDVAYVHFYDLTKFPRMVGLEIGSDHLMFLKPITKVGFWEMGPKMIRGGSLIDVGYYRELPIGTRVKLTTPFIARFKNKTGTIRRGMIMDPENKDGTYDKYRTLLRRAFQHRTSPSSRIRREPSGAG